MKNEFTRLAQMNPELKHDPFVRSMIKRESRQTEEEIMHCMNQLPSRSGWIVLLNNRVDIKSVGNIRYKTKVWYNHITRMVGPNENECNTPFRYARLKNNAPAAGWIEA